MGQIRPKKFALHDSKANDLEICRGMGIRASVSGMEMRGSSCGLDGIVPLLYGLTDGWVVLPENRLV